MSLKVGDLIPIGGGGYSLLSNVENFEASSVGDQIVRLKWKDPEDVIVDGVLITAWSGTQIRGKKGNYPSNEKDGELFIDNKVRNKYQNTPLEIARLDNYEEYYFMAFPYTDKNVFTVDSANRISATPTEIDPNSWGGIQKIVRKGLASDFFTVGDQLMALYDGVETVFEVIGIDVDTPSDPQYTHSMTLQTKDCLYNRVFDPDDDNRYINSPIRTYLNGEFLNKLDPELSAVLGKVDKKVAKRDDLGGGQDSFSDKVFLLSRVEVDLGTEGDTTGEKVYPFYDGVANAARIKNLDGSLSHWWLRSPNVDYSNYVRYVRPDGSIHNDLARNPTGVSPACVII